MCIRDSLYRALLEGIAYGTENLLCQLRENGFAIERLHISGGTAQSDLFLQIHADISNVEILVPRDKQASCPVSYTHLDVYKRQGRHLRLHRPLCRPGDRRRDVYKRQPLKTAAWCKTSTTSRWKR